MKPDYKKFLGQIMNTRRLVIIFMIGVALIVLPGMLTGRTHKTETNKLVSQGTTSLDSATYTKELEKKAGRHFIHPAQCIGCECDDNAHRWRRSLLRAQRKV